MDAGEPTQTSWTGPYRRYDLVREFVIATVVLAALALGLAALFGSPRKDAVTFRDWTQDNPSGFVATTLDELAGTSDTATYGPPYTAEGESVQSLGRFSPQSWAGVRIRVSSPDLVLQPLDNLSGPIPALRAALIRYREAPRQQQTAWIEAYRDALEDTSPGADAAQVPPGDYGPVPVLVEAALAWARSGGFDAALVDQVQPGQIFFSYDDTASELYLADGDFLADIAGDEGLAGDQWGMAATLNNWPGQFWLIPVSFWYQVPPADTSPNGDLIVLLIVLALLAVLLLLPFLPILRDLPVHTRVHRLIWWRYYHQGDE